MKTIASTIQMPRSISILKNHVGQFFLKLLVMFSVFGIVHFKIVEALKKCQRHNINKCFFCSFYATH